VRLDGRTGVGALGASGFEMNVPRPCGSGSGAGLRRSQVRKEQPEGSGVVGLEMVDSEPSGGVSGSIDSS
jgi:hypothetical protein